LAAEIIGNLAEKAAGGAELSGDARVEARA